MYTRNSETKFPIIIFFYYIFIGNMKIELQKQLEIQRAKTSDPKIKAAIDQKLKTLNTPINK